MNLANEKNPSLLGEVRATVQRTAGLPDRRVNPTVAAVITAEDDLTYFSTTLNAVLSGTVVPALIMIVDCAQEAVQNSPTQIQVPITGRTSADGIAQTQNLEIQVVTVSHALSFGDAVSKAIERGSLHSSTAYLWLLHDDSAPVDAHALELLLDTDRNSPGAKVIGAKQVNRESHTLQNVGYYISKNHRRSSLVVDGEEDQAQFDGRQDVYSVSLAGALISLRTWVNLAGTQTWYGTFGESLDFCRRVHLSGQRVVVAPKVAIAHVRARYCGLRTHEGRPIPQKEARSSYSEVMDARDRFVSSETAVWKKPFAWLASVVVSLVVFVANLFAKKPYEAVCELSSPWRALLRTPRSLMARAKLHSAGSLHYDYGTLVATHAQMSEWRQRERVLAAQRVGIVLGPLEQAHLKSLRHHRAAWIGGLAFLGLAATLIMNWKVLGAVFSGSSIFSSTLAPTGASFSQLASTATTMWSFSYATGVAAAPLPFSLVLLAISLFSGGHLAVSVGVLYLLSPILIMISAWALAGVGTRSNPLRFSAALTWGVLPGLLGIYQTANLPMLVVFIFLPLSFFFVFRAVGMYAVDAPHAPHSSVQAGAAAGIIMAFVALSEPQLVIPYFLVFAVFLGVVRHHRAMLLLMPLPSIVVLMPTFFSVIVHFRDGLWRQLFADATVADTSLLGSPGNDPAYQRVLNLINGSTVDSSSGIGRIAMLVLLVAAGLVVVAGVASLFVPSALRLSRMAWVMAASGGVLAFVAPRIAIGADSGVIVASSVLPACAFLLLGLLLAACVVSGRNDSSFELRTDQVVAQDGLNAGQVTRVSLSVILAVVSVAGIGMAGAAWAQTYTVSALKGSGMPIIASQDLEKDPGARVLGLFSDSPSHIEYAVMRTPAGDLIDTNATTQVAGILGTNQQEAQLKRISASLASSNDDTAIDQLSAMGFSGIYVPPSALTARANLVAHVTASGGTEQVVNNAETGLYVRLSSSESQNKHVNTAGEMASYTDPLRILWLVLMTLVVIAYIIVAIPRHRGTQEEGD